MLRRLVRSYYRLRYFPRHLFEALAGISNAIAGLHRQEHEAVQRFMSDHQERLSRIQEEITSFCDDAIRAIVTEQASIASINTRLQALQLGLQRVENGTVDVQGRLAALHKLVQPAENQPVSAVTDLRNVEALTELVRCQSARMDQIETLVSQQTRSLPEPANAPAVSNGSDQMAGDDGRLSRG